VVVHVDVLDGEDLGQMLGKIAKGTSADRFDRQLTELRGPEALRFIPELLGVLGRRHAVGLPEEDGKGWMELILRLRPLCAHALEQRQRQRGAPESGQNDSPIHSKRAVAYIGFLGLHSFS